MTPVTTLEQAQLGALRYSTPLNRVLYLMSADLSSLLLSVVITLTLKAILDGGLDWTSYLRLWPLFFVFPAVFGPIGLYSGIALSPPEEIRRATLSSAFIFLTLAAVTVSFRGGTVYFTWATLLSMSLSMILVPLLRGATRH